MRNVIFLMIGAALLFAGPAYTADQHDTVGRLSLSATGTVDAVPDLATLNAGVVTEAKTAGEALANNRVRMNGVFKALKAAGIKPKDMQTSGLNVSPIYTSYSSSQPRNEPRITGYRASNQVMAIVRDLDGLGAAIDAMVSAGANNIGGISFGLENQQASLNQARKNAMAKLMAKAKLYAEAGGFQVGDIISISESGGYRPQPKANFARMESVSFDSAPSPIAAGEVTSSITVQAVFKIEQ